MFGSVAGVRNLRGRMSWAGGCVFLPAGRSILRKVLGAAVVGRPALIVGDGSGWQEIVRFVQDCPQRGLRMVGSLGIGECGWLSLDGNQVEISSRHRPGAADRRNPSGLGDRRRSRPGHDGRPQGRLRLRRRTEHRHPERCRRDPDAVDPVVRMRRDVRDPPAGPALSRRMQFLKRAVDIVGVFAIGLLARRR